MINVVDDPGFGIWIFLKSVNGCGNAEHNVVYNNGDPLISVTKMS